MKRSIFFVDRTDLSRRVRNSDPKNPARLPSTAAAAVLIRDRAVLQPSRSTDVAGGRPGHQVLVVFAALPRPVRVLAFLATFVVIQPTGSGRPVLLLTADVGDKVRGVLATTATRAADSWLMVVRWKTALFGVRCSGSGRRCRRTVGDRLGQQFN